ncbi:MAG TPA: enoyl-CoA hydratase-related protein [Porticoccaceae bacterium]|nr:enoyl-CoA hydratase-related protein [Porticoccaceae bacterium]
MTTPADSAPPLLSERRGAVGVITFNRPERRNALSPQLLDELCRVLAGWAERGEVRAVVITGAGFEAFSAGYDIRAIETVGPAGQARDADGPRGTPFERALAAVRDFPYPTIAMINGHCFGGALHLALCCDLRIAADHITMGMPPAKLGVVYGAEGLWQFLQVLGSARTRELFFTGRSYRGAELRRLGIVEHWVNADQLAPTVFALADEIGRNAPLALRGIKHILNRLEDPALDPELKAEAGRLVAEAFASSDLQEGQRAFLEKRRPRFTGH